MQFFKLSDAIGVGDTKNDQYRPLGQFFPCILVGGTGAGKTTLKTRLLKKYRFYPLPGRRTLTDRIILPLMQQNDGTHGPVNDRNQRFAYTKGFRDIHPGGMGYVLSRIKIKDANLSTPILFDGLRGIDEIKYASRAILSAFFIVLTALDHVRIKRLMSRQDPFDKIKGNITESDMAEFKKIYSSCQQKTLFEYAKKTGLSEATLYEKATIITKERNNYDHEAASRFLVGTVPDRTIIIDSSKLSPQQIVTVVEMRLQNKISKSSKKNHGKN
jgi:hypothetical protein